VTKPVRVGFVSYARDDAALVDRFINVMRPRCAVQREVELQLWSDRAIVSGERWKREIAVALGAADFGLLCVSPSLLASPFVTTVELPEFLRDERLAIPLALEPLDFDKLDLKGLEALHVFRLRHPGKPVGRSFVECGGVNTKRFCDELVGEIVRRLGAAGRLG
jgi:hypothetical protein